MGELSATIAEGREFGPYVIDKELGSGGMASVWRAHRKDHQPEKLVVLKTMLPHISKQSRFVDMFVREALMSVELSHPNLINVYDVGLIENQYFIEMEYVAGRTVRQVLRRLGQSKMKVELPWALAAMADCCDALAYIHDLRDEDDQSRFLVHRDVSPENVMMSYGGQTKLLDFGIATPDSGSLTAVGERKGKMHYMPPEAFRSAPADKTRDIYAVGAMVYELVAGRRPFTGKDDAELMFQIAEAGLVAPQHLREEVSENLNATIMDALNRDPKSRIQDAAELGHRLRDALSEIDSRPTTAILAESMDSLFGQDFVEEVSVPDDGLATVGHDEVEDFNGSNPLISPSVHDSPAAPVGTEMSSLADLFQLPSRVSKSSDDGRGLHGWDQTSHLSERHANEEMMSEVFTLSVERRRTDDGPNVFSLYGRAERKKTAVESENARAFLAESVFLPSSSNPSNIGIEEKSEPHALKPNNDTKQPEEDGPEQLALVHFERGLEHKRGGRLTAALAEWELAAELDPDNRTIATNVRILKRKME